MKKKFGGGKPPTGTPSLAWSCVVVVASLLAGASVVHNIYKPDLVTHFFKSSVELQGSFKLGNRNLVGILDTSSFYAPSP